MSSTQQKPQGQVERSPRTRRERARTFAIGALVIAITLFAAKNTAETKIDWVVGSGRAPVIIVIVVSVLIGAVISYFADRRASKRR